MSIRAQQWAIGQDVPASKGVSAGPKRHVLLLLAWHHNGKTGECRPSERLLADESGMGERTVRRALAALIEDGLVVTTRPGRTRANRYHFPGLDRPPRLLEEGEMASGREGEVSSEQERTLEPEQNGKADTDRGSPTVRRPAVSPDPALDDAVQKITDYLLGMGCADERTEAVIRRTLRECPTVSAEEVEWTLDYLLRSEGVENPCGYVVATLRSIEEGMGGPRSDRRNEIDWSHRTPHEVADPMLTDDWNPA